MVPDSPHRAFDSLYTVIPLWWHGLIRVMVGCQNFIQKPIPSTLEKQSPSRKNSFKIIFLWVSDLWIQQDQMIVQFQLFLLSIMMNCIDPYTMSFEFAARIGLGQILLKKKNEKASIPRKWSPWAAGVKSLESDQASDYLDLTFFAMMISCVY